MISCSKCRNTITNRDFYYETISEYDGHYIHNYCLDDYIKQNELFTCNKCLRIGSLKKNNFVIQRITNHEETESKQQEKLLYFHSHCMPDFICPICNVTEKDLDSDELLHIMVDEYNTRIFHKKCIENHDSLKLCKKCNKSLLLKCDSCSYRFKHMCYNDNCESNVSNFNDDYFGGRCSFCYL